MYYFLRIVLCESCGAIDERPITQASAEVSGFYIMGQFFGWEIYPSNKMTETSVYGVYTATLDSVITTDDIIGEVGAVSATTLPTCVFTIGIATRRGKAAALKPQMPSGSVFVARFCGLRAGILSGFACDKMSRKSQLCNFCAKVIDIPVNY